MTGVFLIFGLFASGASRRVFGLSQPGGSIGLWVQMLAVVVATIAGVVATIRAYGSRRPVGLAPERR